MEELIKKYWQGLLTEQERKELLFLLDKESTDFRKIEKKGFLEDTDHPDQTSYALDEEKFTRLLTALHQRIDEREETLPIPNDHNVKKQHWIWVAASLVLFIGIAWGIFLDRAKHENSINHAALSAVYKTIKTNDSDSILRFYLPDSSIVELYAHSSLVFDEQYNVIKRHLVLEEGGARFKVAKNPYKPFLVESNKLVTTAIGTDFSVESYPKKDIVVKLYHGKISVHGALKNGHTIPLTFLFPGEMFIVNTSTGSTVLHDAEQLYKNNKQIDQTDSAPPIRNIGAKSKLEQLAFNQQPVDLVFQKVMHFYNIKIQYNKSQVRNLWFTGSFDRNAPIDDVLSTICNINNLSYQKDNDTIIIQSN